MANTQKQHKMTPLSPEEVMQTIAVDFKKQRITHAVAAQRLGFGSKQTLSNIISSHRYMSRYHAEKFVEAFGYSFEFLTSGVGDLYPDEQDYVPEEYAIKSLDHEGPYTLLDFTEEGDIKVILNWVRRIFALTGNPNVQAIYPEIYRFANSRSIAKVSMKGFEGDESSYQLEYTNRFTKLQSLIADNVERMINELQDSVIGNQPTV